jgi:hypothetical protein
VSPPRIATVPGVVPIVQIGIGQTYGPQQNMARWDVAHWDTDSDAHWAGSEPSWVDVTCNVREVQSRVGHDRTLDTWDVGTATVTLDNADGWADIILDPLDPASLSLRPGRALRWGIGIPVPGYIIPGHPAIPAHLDPQVGTVTTVQAADDPAGQYRVVADPVDAVSFWRRSGGNVEVGKNTAGVAYSGPLRSLQYTATRRARLVFPGVTGNYCTVPDAPSFQITGDIEIVARIAPTTWASAAVRYFVSKDALAARGWALAVGTAGSLLMNWAAGAMQPVSTPLGGVNGVPLWVKFTRVAATGLCSFYSALDSPTEPTTWTVRGTATGVTPFGQNTGPLSISGRLDDNREPFAGRIARVIVRNGIAGTTVLDVSENNAGTMTDTTHFQATSGQTVTVVQTAGNTIVQPQPDTLAWRFDAADYPGTGLTYTDPRSRTWTLSTAGAIVPLVPAVPDVIVPARLDVTWRFRGFIDTQRAAYQGPRADNDTVILDAVDALGEVGRVRLGKADPPVGAGDTVHDRLNRILDAAAWRPEWRNLAPNNVPLLATDMDGQTIDLLSAASDSAGGATFGDYQGRVAFRGRDWQTWIPGTDPDVVIGNVAPATVCPSSIDVVFPRAGTTTRALVNYDGADGAPIQLDDWDAQLLYGVETAPERLDLQTADPWQLDTLATRLLETRGVSTMPRVQSLTLDAGRDEATMQAMLSADPQLPSRWRLLVERAGRPLLDRMLLVTAVDHSWDPHGWTCSITLDDAEPWAAAGGRWDGAYWDATTWTATTVELLAEAEAMLAELREATA